MTAKVKIALIGCGLRSLSHLKGLKILKRAGFDMIELKAVCDVKEERAKEAASRAFEEFGAKPKVYSNFEKMIKESSLDAVDIVVDHRFHHVVTVSCLDAGLNVLLEKPLAVTIKAGHAMNRAARENGKILAVAEDSRRTPENRAVKFAIDLNIIGNPFMLFYQWGGVGNRIFCATPWRHMKLEVGGGPMLDNGVHDADLFRYWLGPVKKVFAVTRMFEKERFGEDCRIEPTADDTCFALVEFESGAIGQWAGSWAFHGESFHECMKGKWLAPPQMFIYGSKGSLNNYSLATDGGSRLAKEDFVKRFSPAEEFPRGVTDGVALEQLDFARAILEGTKVEVDGLESLKDEAVCFAAYESALIGRPVKVKDVLEQRIESYQKPINESLGI